jgi:hypothetical protein
VQPHVTAVLQHGPKLSSPQRGQPDETHVHEPFWQLKPIAQAWVEPQPPQLFRSVCSLTHAPLQDVKPLLQVKPHTPFSHEAVALPTPVVHAVSASEAPSGAHDAPLDPDDELPPPELDPPLLELLDDEPLDEPPLDEPDDEPLLDEVLPLDKAPPEELDEPSFATSPESAAAPTPPSSPGRSEIPRSEPHPAMGHRAGASALHHASLVRRSDRERKAGLTTSPARASRSRSPCRLPRATGQTATAPRRVRVAPLPVAPFERSQARRR